MLPLRYLILFVALLPGPGAYAQDESLSRIVSAHYDRVQLKHALNDLQRRYDIQFSYSSDHIPVTQKVSAHRERTPLREVLDDLLGETKVVYAQIGKQIVLKIDPGKPIRDPWTGESGKMGYQRPDLQILPIGSLELAPIEGPIDASVVKKQTVVLPPPSQTAFPRWNGWAFLDSMNIGMPEGKKIFQASVFPPFGSNGWESSRTSNLFSVNLLAGLSAGVEGSEWSLLLNTTEGSVRGAQVSGLANVAEGVVSGMQVAGGVNIALSEANGRQISGLMNVAGEMTGAQLALLANFSGKKFHGKQVSGLFNYAGGAGAPRSVQLSPLCNFSAGEVGFQAGLINIADTVSGASIGLINLVRKGYNRVELAAGESLWTNLSLKMGTRRFYNVYHFGFRWGGQFDEHIWGIGYGFGTAFTLTRRFDLHLEGGSTHLSKGGGFTERLNLLNQLRLSLDWKAGKHFSLFAGGTLNLMASRVQDPETGEMGYDIAPHNLYHKVSKNGTDIQAWAGLTAGVRF